MPSLVRPGRAKESRVGAGVPAGRADKPRAAQPPAAAKAHRPAKAIMSSGAFARRQIARLEPMIEALIEKATGGDAATIDRILKLLDRLERYHGFSPVAAGAAAQDNARDRILRKLSDVDARRGASAEGA